MGDLVKLVFISWRQKPVVKRCSFDREKKYVPRLGYHKKWPRFIGKWGFIRIHGDMKPRT